MKKALIIVDVQNDFVEGGSLAVAGGRDLADRLKEYILANKNNYDLFVTTQDWHIDPGNHFSTTPDFKNSWPVHCRAETVGAELLPAIREALGCLAFDLANPKPVVQVVKGMYEAAYSGFEGENNRERFLNEILWDRGITAIDVVGIATDHCVKATALDGAEDGFDTTVLSGYTVGIDGDAIAEIYNNIFPTHNVTVK